MNTRFSAKNSKAARTRQARSGKGGRPDARRRSVGFVIAGRAGPERDEQVQRRTGPIDPSDFFTRPAPAATTEGAKAEETSADEAAGDAAESGEPTAEADLTKDDGDDGDDDGDGDGAARRSGGRGARLR